MSNILFNTKTLYKRKKAVVRVNLKYNMVMVNI